MFDPHAFSKYHEIQRVHKNAVLDSHMKLIKWGPNDNVLDIGCGDGAFLINILKPKMPHCVAKIVGIDVAEKMIHFAKNKYSDSGVKFEIMDASTKNIPDYFRGEFHHIFSMFCLHWVRDQRQSMKNIFDMLKPGGDFLIIFPFKNPIYEVYNAMKKSSKWAPYMQDVDRFLTPYQYADNPSEVLENLLMEVGFVNRQHKTETLPYTYPDLPTFRNFYISVSPWVSNIPSSKITEFNDDFIDELMKTKHVTVTNGNGKKDEIKALFEVFVIYASKP